MINAAVCLLDTSKVFYTFLAVSAFLVILYAFIFVVAHKRYLNVAKWRTELD